MRGSRRTGGGRPPSNTLPKTPTGIAGLDEVTEGGLPRGRTTLVCGGAGCGKTLFGIEFLVRGATQYDEPGVFIAFEETAEELAANVASLGFDLNALCARKKLAIDHVHLERSEIEETGTYDLEGLFIRIGYAIDAIGAKRVVLDTVEMLFAGFRDEAILRAELRRLFRWLKQKGVTAIITGERGEGTLTRHGLEEYVADCVILLDHRVTDQNSTRSLRVVKYRGSLHGVNEYPFLIGAHGFSVIPITSLGLEHTAPLERISTGIPRLDAMLEGGGVYRGSSVLITGTAGTGKSSIGAHFVDAAARRGERALYFAFEESPRQILRNMRSIGIDLEPWTRQDLLRIHAARASLCGLEMHLVQMHQVVEEFQPRVVVIDPITNLISAGSATEVKGMLTRLIDFLKQREITGVFTSLTLGSSELEQTDVGISSLMDAWVLVRGLESNGERNRVLYLLKSRGMAHSNQMREFIITDDGIQLLDVYVGPAGVLTGTARHAQEAREEAEAAARRKDLQQREHELARKREIMARQVAALQAEFAAEEEALRQSVREFAGHEEMLAADRVEIARLRRADREPPAAEAVRMTPSTGESG